MQRGVSCLDDAENFLKPKLDDLHNPELMLNMDKAVKRLNKAISHERIMVYGDYDVDGTTSVAMVAFLEALDVQIVPYIPMRYQEGYGVSKTE